MNLATGNEIWQKQPWKEPGGPNEGRPWYDQKFSWHLSPPSVDNGKLYFGSFLPSFYWIFQAFPFILDANGHAYGGWPSFNTNYKQYWVGRDGWSYCADKNTGSILWGWDPGGCGVTNIPPVAGGKVFFNADTVTDYHYGQMAACDVNTGEKLWHVGPVHRHRAATRQYHFQGIRFSGLKETEQCGLLTSPPGMSSGDITVVSA